jgi:putative membrane protein
MHRARRLHDISRGKVRKRLARASRLREHARASPFHLPLHPSFNPFPSPLSPLPSPLSPPSFRPRRLDTPLIDNHKTHLFSLFWQYRLLVLAAISITALVEIANDYIVYERPAFSAGAIGLLVTALAISLVFRVNEAYSRWWEARTLWGSIVNESRSWSRQVMSFLPSGEGEETVDLSEHRRRLIHRQIAWANAARLQLREEQEPTALAAFLSGSEVDAMAVHPNPPAALLQTQAEEIAGLRSRGLVDRVSQHRMDQTLSNLTDALGGCERIKKTAFPDRVAFFTRSSAWLMALMIPLLIQSPENAFDVIDYAVVPMMMLSFLLTERLGAELKQPFESLPNDTPMTSICRRIEIDLRAALGETDLPKPLRPENGILM